MGENPAQDKLVVSVTEKVNRWLAEHGGGYDVGQTGSVSIQYGSARVFVEVVPWADENVLVRIQTLVLIEVPKSPELYEWIAFNAGNYYFGAIYLATSNDDPDAADVLMEHNLLGDYIDLDEFLAALGGIASTADELDTELEGKFGGKKFHEDPS